MNVRWTLKEIEIINACKMKIDENTDNTGMSDNKTEENRDNTGM